MSRLVRASPRTSRERADDEDRGVDAALQQRPRDDEAVAAVVAAPAQDGDAPVELRFVGRLDGGHDLAAGVLHQHERRNADVFDGEPVGLAHLRGGENSHACAECTIGQAQGSGSGTIRDQRSHGSDGQRQRPHHRRARRGHLGLRSRLPLRRRHVRDAAHLQPPAVSLRPPRAAAAPLGADDRARRAVHRRRAAAGDHARRWRARTLRGEAYVRVLVTRGVGELTYDPKATPTPSSSIIVKPQVDPPAERLSRRRRASPSSTSSAIIPAP